MLFWMWHKMLIMQASSHYGISAKCLIKGSMWMGKTWTIIGNFARYRRAISWRLKIWSSISRNSTSKKTHFPKSMSSSKRSKTLSLNMSSLLRQPKFVNHPQQWMMYLITFRKGADKMPSKTCLTSHRKKPTTIRKVKILYLIIISKRIGSHKSRNKQANP